MTTVLGKFDGMACSTPATSETEEPLVWLIVVDQDNSSRRVGLRPDAALQLATSLQEDAEAIRQAWEFYEALNRGE